MVGTGGIIVHRLSACAIFAPVTEANMMKKAVAAAAFVVMASWVGLAQDAKSVIGAASPDRVQILSGLTAGDSVVRSATFLLDAESNLGTLLGGMGDMPGMDLTAPTTQEKPDAHTNH